MKDGRLWMDAIRLSGAQTQMTKLQKATESGTPANPPQTRVMGAALDSESSGGEINAAQAGVSAAFKRCHFKSTATTVSGAGV
jgi:hypothetical protein